LLITSYNYFSSNFYYTINVKQSTSALRLLLTVI